MLSKFNYFTTCFGSRIRYDLATWASLVDKYSLFSFRPWPSEKYEMVTHMEQYGAITFINVRIYFKSHYTYKLSIE